MRRTLVAIAGIMVGILPAPAQAQSMDGGEQDGSRDAHRGLQIATLSSLGVTGAMGTILAFNQPTVFGDGRCPGRRLGAPPKPDGASADDGSNVAPDGQGADPILGEYGCDGFSVLHGVMGILSSVLYAATTTLEFAEFGWPGREEHGTAYHVASGIHLGGMVALPLLGIISAIPAVIGLNVPRDSTFSRVVRTVHLILGYVTVGTYAATAGIELE